MTAIQPVLERDDRILKNDLAFLSKSDRNLSELIADSSYKFRKHFTVDEWQSAKESRGEPSFRSITNCSNSSVIGGRSFYNDTSNMEQEDSIQNVLAMRCIPPIGQGLIFPEVYYSSESSDHSSLSFSSRESVNSYSNESSDEATQGWINITSIQPLTSQSEGLVREYVCRSRKVKRNQHARVNLPQTTKTRGGLRIKRKNIDAAFTCEFCLKSFATQRVLKRHMKTHSDVKRYLCPVCKKGFNDSFDLKRHQRIHSGIKPFQCSFCERAFTQRCSLEVHFVKIHGIEQQYGYNQRRAKVYVCEECGNTANKEENHYLHLKDKHPNSPELAKLNYRRLSKFKESGLPDLT